MCNLDCAFGNLNIDNLSGPCAGEWGECLWEHSTPSGLLQWTGCGGQWAHRGRGQRQSGVRPSLLEHDSVFIQFTCV